MSDSDVTTPADILADDLREKLKTAVIAAYMGTTVYTAGDHSVKSFVSTEWDDTTPKRFNYRASILGEDYPVYCEYPSGDWSLDVKIFPDVGDYPGFTAIEVNGAWDEIRAMVDTWLDPWVNDCPTPWDFKNQINSVARIASQLDIAGGGGDGESSGDSDLREAVKAITNRSTDGNSRAIVAFRDAYASDLWTTVNNQCGATASAGLAMTAEGQAWSKTYQSLRDLIKVSIGDFNSLADGPGTGESAALGATAAVAGLLGATVGVAFPPFGVAMGGLGAVIGVYTVMNPAVPTINQEPLKLSGGDYYAMWDSFTDEVRKVSSDLAAAERAVARGCRVVVADTHHNPENYSLSRNTNKGEQYDDFGQTLVTEIDVPKDLLKEMAGSAELIGDQQVTLSGYLTGVDGYGNPSSTVNDEWYRGVLPDGTRIGMDDGGIDGPYADYAALVAALGALLAEEGENSRQMAEALMATALEYDLSDGRSAEQSQHIDQQIDVYAGEQDHNPTYRGNDPGDDWYQKNS